MSPPTGQISDYAPGKQSGLFSKFQLLKTLYNSFEKEVKKILRYSLFSTKSWKGLK